jgi:anaerobic magnesium-protoporphyrin IX monomethyl ester cyclase
VKGISYDHQGTINTTENRTLKIDLDTLKTERDFVELSDYIDVRTMLTSRGCVGRCSFCPTTDYWGIWRAKSAGNVVDEIGQLVEQHDAKKILFLDDNATASKERMKSISKEIIDRGIDTRLGCLGTIQAYDKETIEEMHKAGFRWIHYGAESGNDDVLHANGKNITSGQIRKAIVETRDAGLRVRASWIFDLPGTDERALQDTIGLILDTEPEEIRAHFLALRAGTELYSRRFRGEEVPSQYIHGNRPSEDLNSSRHDHNNINDAISTLTSELKNKGYLIINNVSAWRDIDRLRAEDPKLRFISFCPSRYGLDWERT